MYAVGGLYNNVNMSYVINSYSSYGMFPNYTDVKRPTHMLSNRNPSIDPIHAVNPIRAINPKSQRGIYGSTNIAKNLIGQTDIYSTSNKTSNLVQHLAASPAMTPGGYYDQHVFYPSAWQWAGMRFNYKI